jgi:SAM-dependent methyltransferase
MKEDLADRIRLDAEVFDRQAPKYGKAGDDLMHAIPAEAEELYRQDLRDVLGPFGEYKSVLEIGAGTGLFTRLLGRWGCKGITGIDISGEMLAVAKSTIPDGQFKAVTTESDPELFPAESFDLIISRQLICHLIDPIRVFECWRRWLKPCGKIAVIDGFWTRADWGSPSSRSARLVEDRPLSCTQTSATASYLLERANLMIQHRRMMTRVNDFAKAHYRIGQTREPIFRYVIVATA